MTESAPESRSALLPGRMGLFVRVAAHPGGRAALLDALHRYSDQLEAEPGTELFAISLDPDDEDVVWLYEWFKDEQALEQHRESAPFAELMSGMQNLVAGSPGMLRIDPLRLTMKTNLLDDVVSSDGF